MPDTILVVVEQREGKLNRVSWETITAGQAIAAATGWSLEAAVVGGSAATFAAEVAAKKVAKVYGISGRGLAKACARLRVPVPPRGYWARVQNGHKERKPPLPSNAALRSV